MLDDSTLNRRHSEMQRDNETNGVVSRINQSLSLLPEVVSATAQVDTNSICNINILSSSNNSTSPPKSDHNQLHLHHQHHHSQEQLERQHITEPDNLHQLEHQFTNSGQQHLDQQQQQHHHHHHQQQQERHLLYFGCAEPVSNYSKYNPIPGTSSVSLQSAPNINSILNVDKTEIQSQPSNLTNMNVDSQHHNIIIPTAHGSDHQIIYPLPENKSLSNSNPSAGILNFSHHDLSNQNEMHQHLDNGLTKTSQISSCFESTMMQSAVTMNMWKNPINLNHHFKPPTVVDHNFLQNSDLNSFSNWPHAPNLNHQSTSVAHQILDSQQIFSYSQHPRSLPIVPQDSMVGSSIKTERGLAGQASFMINSSNHQASTSQTTSSNHQSAQPLDNLNLSTSYNLTKNDNQFYNTRSESRSHSNAIIKPQFMVPDRSSVHMTLGNNKNHLPYHNIEHANLQPTTSNHQAGSSSDLGGSSKNVGSFRCSTCNEVFSLRTVYQSHLKTHSQDKGKLLALSHISAMIDLNHMYLQVCPQPLNRY